MEQKKNVILFNNGNLPEDFKQRERESIHAERDEYRRNLNFNNVKILLLFVAISWLAVFGAFCAWPVIKTIF